jgi:hypothetical protein
MEWRLLVCWGWMPARAYSGTRLASNGRIYRYVIRQCVVKTHSECKVYQAFHSCETLICQVELKEGHLSNVDKYGR